MEVAKTVLKKLIIIKGEAADQTTTAKNFCVTMCADILGSIALR